MLCTRNVSCQCMLLCCKPSLTASVVLSSPANLSGLIMITSALCTKQHMHALIGQHRTAVERRPQPLCCANHAMSLGVGMLLETVPQMLPVCSIIADARPFPDPLQPPQPSDLSPYAMEQVLCNTQQVIDRYATAFQLCVIPHTGQCHRVV